MTRNGGENIDKSKKEGAASGKVTLRKLAGIISLVVGIPNLLIGVVMTLSGIAAVVVLGVIVVKLLFEEPSDSFCGPLLIVLLLILFIFLLVAAIFFTIIAFIFAIGVAGQAIGGIYGFRGIRYTRTIVLTLIGSIVSLLAGIGLIVLGLSVDNSQTAAKVGTLLLGAFDIFAFFVTMTSFILYIIARDTFREPEKKEKKKKKEKRKKEDETVNDDGKEVPEEKGGKKVSKPAGWEAEKKDEE